MSSLLRADLARALLGKHSRLPNVCKVSRDGNQLQRARLILQTLTHEEPLTAKAGVPWEVLLSVLIPIHSLGRWEV